MGRGLGGGWSGQSVQRETDIPFRFDFRDLNRYVMHNFNRKYFTAWIRGRVFPRFLSREVVEILKRRESESAGWLRPGTDLISPPPLSHQRNASCSFAAPSATPASPTKKPSNTPTSARRSGNF